MLFAEHSTGMARRRESHKVPLPLMGVWTGDIGYRRAETWVTLEQNGLIVIRRENDHALARGVGHVVEV